MKIPFLILSALLLQITSCQSNKRQATVSSLEDSVAEMQSLLASGKTNKFSQRIINVSDKTPAGATKLTNQLVKSKFLETAKFVKGKVSSNIGVAVISTAVYSLKFAILAKLENGQWTFFIGMHVWANDTRIRELGLTESELKHAFILKKWIETETEVGKSGVNAYDRLKWYLPNVPKDLAIEKFYETPSPAMDHEYMWKIKIQNSDTFERFQKQLTQAPPNSVGKNKYDEPIKFESHPRWWNALDFKKGKLYAHFVEVVGSNGGEKAYLFAFLDENTDYIYIQAF